MFDELDGVDVRILQLLQHDARITTKEMADKLGKSATAVNVRIRKLEDEGYVQRYVALLDRKKVGKNLIAFTMVHLKEHAQVALKNFVRECIKFSEVMECYHLTGDFDFLLKIAIRDMDEYHDFLILKVAPLAPIGTRE